MLTIVLVATCAAAGVSKATDTSTMMPDDARRRRPPDDDAGRAVTVTWEADTPMRVAKEFLKLSF